MMKKTINIDARVDAEEINMELIDYLEKFSPTGYGNPTPLFLVENLKLIRSEPVGKEQNHLKLFLKDEKTNKTYDAIWFSPPKAAFSLKENDTIDIVCNIDKNEWRDNVSIQLRVKDALDQGKRTTV
jgi:single-stranded-DNA-specific exonuclease